jgi:hypothetical protein
VESLYGKQIKYYKTIKVTDNLYITSHSYITQVRSNDIYQNEFGIDLEPKALKKEGQFYKFSNGVKLQNLTDSNIELLLNKIAEDINERDLTEIPKVDITAQAYPDDTLYAYKLLKELQLQENQFIQDKEAKLDKNFK